jgi:tungstate transport system ATP-binding protein
MTAMRAPASELPIEIADATFAVRELTILDRLTLKLEAGPPTMLVGPNGSGKTTLLRLAMGLIAPTGGRITWGGRADVPPSRRAIVFQRPVMLRRSAAANVRYALAAAGVPRGDREGRASELLALVGLEALGDRPARRLSGGEQQRLALARALAKNPAVLFLDEPTASLDPAATKAIEDTIRTIATTGIKVVMATHDLGEARRLAGDIVLMHRGSVIEASPVEVFFSAPKTDAARRFVAGELLI